MLTTNLHRSEAKPQSFNRYAYVNNDPVNLVDPSGLNASSGSSGGCSAEFSYAACGGDSAFWGGGTSGGHGFGDGYGWDQVAYGNMPAHLRAGQDRYLDSINRALYGGMDANGNFDIHYNAGWDENGNLVEFNSRFSISANIYGSGFSRWEGFDYHGTNAIVGLSNAVSMGLVGRALERDRRNGIAHDNIDLNSTAAQTGAVVAAVIPLPSGALGAAARAVNTTSRARTIQRALTLGERWVGRGYREIAPGVFRSANGTRQFRMTTSDILGSHGRIGPHVHFERINPATGRVTGNIHTPIIP